MSLSSRIAGDSCKFGDQMRHDHQQYKPYKSVHGCDNYLQNRNKKKKKNILIASKQHARHAISRRTSLSKLILVDLVIKCELHHDNCNRAVEARLKVKLMPPYVPCANPTNPYTYLRIRECDCGAAWSITFCGTQSAGKTLLSLEAAAAAAAVAAMAAAAAAAFYGGF